MSGVGRRRSQRRRPSFWAVALLGLALASTSASAHSGPADRTNSRLEPAGMHGTQLRGQTREPPQAVRSGREEGPRLAIREIVVMRESPTELRILENLEIERSTADRDGAADASVPLLRLPAGAEEVTSLGGDPLSERVRYEPPDIVLLGAKPDTSARVTLSYRLPEPAGRLIFRAHLPIDRLVISAARTVGEPRVSGGLRPIAASAAGRPAYRSFAAEDLQPNAIVSVTWVRLRIGWRERAAVLLATTLAAALALGRVWRRGAGQA